MPRVKPISENEFSPSIKIAFERHLEQSNDCVTNMKATLAHSLLSFEVYMQWCPLYMQVERILGKRLAYLYAYAITKEAECKLCIAFFRKRIVEGGECPDNFSVTTDQKQLLDFGSGIAKYKGRIADHIYNGVGKKYSNAEMVVLVAFAGQMMATSIFNNVIEVEVDEFLVDYLEPVKYS
jgi:hypothetical protein